ncbi:GNAT family N-acetyltransferase [Algoriphagus sp. D3-2-R+10]|uniref:GNAT family N-acetyltransferase n=1 Tax=Algoriphagus aurantiacus TaxID=3103948 RepID=UPI002B36E28F|nr:GNAT family N-acetyltransferase [Algoriphagus sp. D3-2-R+10]MEB2776793.1 GNAT family N-acetyltransferase [Algoriphagus sp. D3-2-R+10]
MELRMKDYLISTDKEKLDRALVHRFLSTESGWANGISFETVNKAIENCLNFGIYHGNKQIGYAKVISDFSTIAYLGDVFILDKYRGLGLSKWLMECITSHEELQNLRRWILLTNTAPWLYEKYGFTPLTNPDFYMERHNPRVYEV